MTNVPGKKAERVALMGVVIAIVGAILMLTLASYCNSLAARVEIYHFLAGIAVWAVTWLHLRTMRAADEEKLAVQEAERLRAEQGRAKLFEEDSFSAGTYQARLNEMNRYGAPIAAFVIVLIQAITGGIYIYALSTASESTAMAGSLGLNLQAELSNVSMAAVITFVLVFISFLLGKYAAGMSSIPKFKMLRAGAGYIIGNAIVGILMVASFVASAYGKLWGDGILAWIIGIMLIVLSVEMLINLILDFYRPRIPGEIPLPVYGSRLTGLFAEPQGIMHTFSHTLDYQFGFKVSDTWFFRFLNRAIAPLILFQLAVLYFLSCIVIVRPGEVAVIERWGRPLGAKELPATPTPGMSDSERAALEAKWDSLETPLETGYHLKWPWPIDTIRLVERDTVRRLELGSPQDKTGLKNEDQNFKENIVSWDVEHTAGEFKYVMPLANTELTNANVLPAGEVSESIQDVDAMFISGMMSVQYSVGRSEKTMTGDVYRYAYRYSDPKTVMVSICENVITDYLAGASFWQVIVEDINGSEAELKNRIQKAADRAGIGVKVQFVSLSNMHPPVGKVGKAYQEVVGAREEQFAMIHAANAEAIKITGLVPGQVAMIESDAAIYYNNQVLTKKAEAERFEDQIVSFETAPEVFKHRYLVRTASELYAKMPRIITASPDVNVITDDKSNLTSKKVLGALSKEAKGAN